MLSRKAKRGPKLAKKALTIEGDKKQLEIINSPIRATTLKVKRHARKSLSQGDHSPRSMSPHFDTIKLPQRDIESIQKIVIENFKSAINASNGVTIIPPKNKPSYRFYIGPGNNR